MKTRPYVSAIFCLLLRLPLAAQTATPPTPPPTTIEVSSGSSVKIDTPAQSGGEISGKVTTGTTPLPGVTISASNTLTGKKYFTSTDIDGTFSLTIPTNGRFVVKAELVAFAVETKEIVFSKDKPTPKQSADFTLQLFSRVQQQNATQPNAMQQLANSALAGGRGFQNLGLNTSEGGDASPSAGGGAPTPDLSGAASGGGNGMNADASSESVSVSGAMGRTDSMSLGGGDMEDRLQELRDRIGRGDFGNGMQGLNIQIGGAGGGGGGIQINAGGGGPGGGGGGGQQVFIMGGPGGGGRGRFNVNQPHGALTWSFGDSALDARSYSLSGQPANRPSYQQSRVSATLGGPLKIPHLFDFSQSTFYFINYFGNIVTNPLDTFLTVPTASQRLGDFSALLANPVPTVIYQPGTNTPYVNNQVPVSAIAQGLLQYIPLPNVAGATTQNYHRTASGGSLVNNLNLRLVHNFSAATPKKKDDTQQTDGQRGGRNGGGGGGRGAGGGGGLAGMFSSRNNISLGFNYRSGNNDLLNSDPLLGTGTSHNSGWNTNVTWTKGMGKFTTRTTFTYNANHSQSSNFFSLNNQNVAAGLGINGVSTDPFDWGMSGLAFTNFSGVNDSKPSKRDDNTWSFDENISRNIKKHNIRFGGNFRRASTDVRTDSNPNGRFTFTGAATARFSGGVAQPNTGYDLADFLLGYAQQSTIQFGNITYNFRGNAYSAFIQDDWRFNAKWTFNLGLRYEYVGPYTEANNRLTNIDHNANFTQVKEVLPGQVGPISGQQYSSSLVNPDRNNFAPRIGIAWKATKKTVVRAGYSINYNTGAYSNFVQTLAFQPPFTFTQTNAATLGGGVGGYLQVQNAFPAPAVGSLTNNYAVDSNYRLGYAQTWNANIQQDLGHNITMNVNYTGTKGTHLDELTAPNRTATGVLVANVQPYNFLTSLGDSIYHGGTLNLRRRFNHGWSLNGSYTYSKSIDNASGVGGAANIVAQNALDLAAERGPSSFDERHKFNTSLTYELPFGTNKKLLAGKGFANKAFGNWTMNSNFSANSGTPLTIHILGNFSDVARGSNGTLRANPVAGVPVYASNPTLTSYLNNSFLKTIGALAPFTTPATGTYGTLGRNTVRGPGSWNTDMSISKNFPLKESRAIDFRATFSNVFNHARWTSIDSSLGSPTFGQVVGIGAMRRIQFNTSFRF